MRWRDRPTADIIVLILAVSVGLIVVVLTLAVVLAQFISPNLDFVAAARVISGVINTVIGALIGYMAGNRMPQPKDGQ